MEFDICIVGSGAGGAPIAYELSNAGYSIAVLEKGRWFSEEDFSKDEIAVTQREMFTPNLKKERHIIYYRGKRYDGYEYNWSFWNGSLVGGATNLMSGYFHRLKPIDFKLLSTYGPIEGANITDWPISYEELEPFYAKCEEVIGISGKVTKHPFLEPRSTPNFPYPPLKENIVSEWIDKACKKLKYSVFPTPRAILSRPTEDRNSCYYSNFCGSYGCSSKAKGSARVTLLQKSKATIITEAFVYKLKSDASKVTQALYYDRDGISCSIKAKIFIIAAQPIETIRLLLNSKNRFFPKGVANNSGNVGKNLIFSAGGSGSGRIYTDNLSAKEKKLLFTPGLFINRSIQEWYEIKEGGKAFKGGTIDFLFEHQNIIPRAMSIIYDKDKPLYGKELCKKIENLFKKSRVIKFEIFNDWLPTKRCFVDIEEKVRDFRGVPVAAIHLYSHPHDLRIGKFLAKKATDILKEMGAKEIVYDISDLPPPNLQAGGCRFGEDPKTSVLDRNCKAHELENLYITDASFMPTGGSVPYTCTIYANAFRVAEYLKKNLKN